MTLGARQSLYNYVCKFPKTTAEEVRQAIHLVRDLHFSHRKAADATGVTRSVLEKYLKKKDEEIPENLSQGRFKPTFTAEQEKQIVLYCHDLANKFYGMTRGALGQLAYNLADENKLPHRFTNGTAGHEWIRSFLIRHHRELCERTGTPTSLIRITSFTKAAVYRFFDQLEAIIAENHYTAATIYNADETGITIVPNKAPKVLAQTGTRTVPVITPVERGQLVTVMCCASAQGQVVPPMFVFPNKCKDTNISLSPSGFSPKGWSNCDAFCVWLKHFRNHATPCKTTWVLLLVDNHGSHIRYEAVKFAAKNHIDILTLQPHTTHKLQPMYIWFFSPLKKRYSKVLTEWQAKHRGMKPRTDNIPWIIKPAYEEACKEETMINGFRKTGIWDPAVGGPNRYVFEESEFADTPSETVANEATSELRDETQVYASKPDTEPLAGTSRALGGTDVRVNDSGPKISTVFNRDFSVTPLVPYYGSLSDDEDDEESYDMISVGVQVNLPELIQFSEAEIELTDDEIQVILPSQNRPTGDPVDEGFEITPWDLEIPPTADSTEQPKRKSRAKGSSELMTSKDNISKLHEKEKLKRKKGSSDSEDGRITRSKAKSSQRSLRSSTKSGSSSQ